MKKIKQYLKENAFSLTTIFTSTFGLIEFWKEWMHAPLGLKVWVLIIGLLYIFIGAYVDVLGQTIKWNREHINLLAEKTKYLEGGWRRER